jgi:hypothetical protein
MFPGQYQPACINPKKSFVKNALVKGIRLHLLILGVFLLDVQSILAASGLFPKMPAAAKVFVVNIHSDGGDAKRAAWALQGLVNQSSAQVYTLSIAAHLEQLKHSETPFEILTPLPGDNAGLRTLFQKYKGCIKKMFVYDPDKDWSWYLALMAAAQQEGIPVTESLRNDLASEFGWQGTVENFQNRWTNRIEAYDWALTNLMPNCSTQVVFALRMDKRLCDYVVASKGFDFWLDRSNPKELAETQKIFHTKGYGLGTSLMGYASDGANEIANPHGIGYVVSDYYGNGSFWSSFPNKTYTQSAGKAVVAQPGKIYASIMWSDGDNLQFDQNALYDFWHDPARGTIPVATPLSPTLQEINSPLLDWYYSNLTDNDELVAGPTRVQFIYVRDYNSALFPAWCKLTRTWCADAGFHSSRIWIAPNPSAKYNTYMQTCGFDGVIGEGWAVQSGFPPKIDACGAGDEDALFNQFTNVSPNPRAPVFVNFTPIVQGFDTKNGGYSAVKRQVDRLEAAYPDRYVFLLPKDEFATMRAYYNTNKLKLAAQLGVAEGLMPIPNEDGNFTIVDRDGVRCWQVPQHNYFYLDVADSFLVQPGARLEIDLAYFDAGSGDIALDYDSADARLVDGGAFKRYPYAIHLMNTATWKLARFWVNDARFANRQNGGADFRFYNGGDDLRISAVQLRRE